MSLVTETMDIMEQQCRNNPWLPLLLLVSLLLLSGVFFSGAHADHEPPDGSNGKGADGKHGYSGGDGDCHGHSHGHHPGCGGEDHDGKHGQQGTPPAPAGSNPWVVSPPGLPRPPGASSAAPLFTASAGVVVLAGGAAVGWLLRA